MFTWAKGLFGLVSLIKSLLDWWEKQELIQRGVEKQKAEDEHAKLQLLEENKRLDDKFNSDPTIRERMRKLRSGHTTDNNKG